MKLTELLYKLKELAIKLNIATPMICGGAVRDRYLAQTQSRQLKTIADLDITTGTKQADYLSSEYYLLLHKQYNVSRKIMNDHSTIFVGSLKLDFSSNFNVPQIEQILQTLGIKNPTDLQKEMYSRDFTCNALLMTLDLKSILDPTKKGFQDIKDKKIKTCLSPNITLTSNRNRVVRAIYLACKLDFDLDTSIIEYVKKHPQTISISTPKSMADKLGEAFTRDGDKAADLLTKMNLWNHIPIVQPAYPYYQKYLQQGIKKASYFVKAAGPNYDLGKGLYQEMSDGKIDSVKEFREEGNHGPATIMNFKKKKDVNYIDFATDEQIHSDPIIGNSGSSYVDSIPISYQENYTDLPDPDDKTEANLNFGNDLTEEALPGRPAANQEIDLDDLEGKYLEPAETGLFGLPDGLEPEAHDAAETISTENSDYGITDSGRQMYEDKWNI